MRRLLAFTALIVLFTAALSGAAIAYGHAHRGAGVISFESYRGRDNDLFLYDLAAQTTAPLTRSPSFDFGAAWSPDGSWMAFGSSRGASTRGGTTLFLMDMRDFHVDQLLPFSLVDTSGISQSLWSPDGHWLAAYSAGSFPYLYVFDMTADPPTWERANVQSPDGHIAWSPDSTRVSISGYFNNGVQIAAYDVTLHRLVNLTYAQAAQTFDGGAAWSPDGHQMAFIRTQRDSTLMVMNADGSNLHPILGAEVARYAYPSWMPDGRWLLVDGQRNSVRGLLLVDTLNGDSQMWVPDYLQPLPLLFSSDGNDLIYSSYGDRPGGSGLQLTLIHARADHDTYDLPVSLSDPVDPQWVPW